MAIDLHTALAGEWTDATRPKGLYRHYVCAEPAPYVDAIVAGLEAEASRVRNGCAELASLLSEDAPALLYAHRERFAANLGANAPILRWEAACTLGNLAAVDAAHALGEHVPALVALLRTDGIVLQGHAARALAKIARVMPEHADGILDALIGAEDRFPGNRVGYLVEGMEAFAGDPRRAARARAFAQRHAESEAAPVKRKARRALNLLG